MTNDDGPEPTRETRSPLNERLARDPETQENGVVDMIPRALDDGIGIGLGIAVFGVFIGHLSAAGALVRHTSLEWLDIYQLAATEGYGSFVVIGVLAALVTGYNLAWHALRDPEEATDR